MSLSLDSLLDVACEYRYARSFIVEEVDLYVKALELDLWDRVVQEMDWKVVIEWRKLPEHKQKRILLASFSHAKSAKQWEKDNPGLYSKASESGWWPELMESRGWTATMHWENMTQEQQKQAVLDEAREYEYSIIFQTQANRYYQKALELGIREEATSHMKDSKELRIDRMTAKEAIRLLRRLEGDTNVHIGLSRESFGQ
ncbi:MAG: hypothetical protein WBG65_00410 [Sulfurimonadaceae bacterium]